MQDLIGTKIDRYLLLETLGEGGMATVYKAADDRLGVEVAIKLLRNDSLTEDIKNQIYARFMREARLLAQLDHPNIISIIDYGNYQGSPYLVMKYMPKGTLRKFTGKPRHYQTVARILAPIADALAYAHDRGIVHRDIKPSNILVSESGSLILSDFGIVKILESNERTLTNISMGTPEYMAPEQWQGTTLPASDQYSLGVVMYELITGVKPYQADTPASVAIKQATEPPPRPSQMIQDLPARVEAVILRALAKDPHERFENMHHFRQALLSMVDSPRSPGADSAGSQEPRRAKNRRTSTPSGKSTNQAPVSPPHRPAQRAAPAEKTPLPVKSAPPGQTRKAMRWLWLLPALAVFGAAAFWGISAFIRANDRLNDLKDQVPSAVNPTAMPTSTPTQVVAVQPGRVRVDYIMVKDGETYSVSEDPSVEPPLGTDKTGIQTPLVWDSQYEADLDVSTTRQGVMLSVGSDNIKQENNQVFVYENSLAHISYTSTDGLDLALEQGALFVSLAAGERITTVHLPGGAMAYVEGSQMLLVLDGPQVSLWCLEGRCRFEFAGSLTSYNTNANQRTVYYTDTNLTENPVEILYTLYDEIWGWNEQCGRCMLTIPEPTPTPTATFMPPTDVPNQVTSVRPSNTPRPTNTPRLTRTPTRTPTPTKTIYIITTTAPPNHPPVAQDQDLELALNSTINITLRGTDSDGDSLTFKIESWTDLGKLEGTAPNMTYTSYSSPGSTSFTFSVSDGKASDDGTVRITINPGSTDTPQPTSTPTKTATTPPPANNPPFAYDQMVCVDRHRPETNFTLQAWDPDGDALIYTLLEAPDPRYGHIIGWPSGPLANPPTLTFLLNEPKTGVTHFLYMVTDPGDLHDDAEVVLEVRIDCPPGMLGTPDRLIYTRPWDLQPPYPAGSN